MEYRLAVIININVNWFRVANMREGLNSKPFLHFPPKAKYLKLSADMFFILSTFIFDNYGVMGVLEKL